MTKMLSWGIGFFLFSLNFLLAQSTEAFKPEKKYPKDSLSTWAMDLMEELSESHPGYYRYTSKEAFDQLIDSTLGSMKDSLTSLEYYRKLKPLIAQIGCLHTSINLSPTYEQYVAETYPLLPLQVFINSEREVFVTKDFSQKIPAKSKILSINQRPISTILTQLYKAIPSDGYNQSLKSLLLKLEFAYWYQSQVELTDSFVVDIQVADQVKRYVLPGVAQDSFPSQEELMLGSEAPLSMRIEKGVAFVRVATFAKSLLKERGFKYKSFIDEVFDRLEKEKIGTLVLDLRNNTGGTDGNAVYLASHFFTEPFRYWEKIEVTEKIAGQIKGINRLFYPKPKPMGDMYRWQGALMTGEFDYYHVQKASKNPFKGQTYVITNGLCMSSCADVVAILAHNNKIQVVGEETGGGYQGNTSGMMPEAEVFPDMLITVPLQKYTNAVDPEIRVGRGSKVDHPITYNLDEWMEGVDKEMQVMKKILKIND